VPHDRRSPREGFRLEEPDDAPDQVDEQGGGRDEAGIGLDDAVRQDRGDAPGRDIPEREGGVLPGRVLLERVPDALPESEDKGAVVGMQDHPEQGPGSGADGEAAGGRVDGGEDLGARLETPVGDSARPATRPARVPSDDNGGFCVAHWDEHLDAAVAAADRNGVTVQPGKGRCFHMDAAEKQCDGAAYLAFAYSRATRSDGVQPYQVEKSTRLRG